MSMDFTSGPAAMKILLAHVLHMVYHIDFQYSHDIIKDTEDVL